MLSRELRLLFVGCAILFAAAFFVMGMEEESWFQMILNYQTPSWLATNQQGEANLHNFASDRFNIIYYASAFLFLILIPFVNDRTRLFKNFERLSFFIPSRSVIFISAIFPCMFYTHWASPSAQLCFFMTLFILCYYQFQISRGAIEPGIHKYWLPLLIVVCVLSQAFVLIQGPTVVSWNAIEFFHKTSETVLRTKRLEFGWDVAEYREFFMPFAYAVYSIEMFKKSRSLVGR